MDDAARRRSARQGDRHRRASSRRCSSSASQRWCKQGVAEGAVGLSARAATARQGGCFYPPTLVTDVQPAVDRGAGGDLRAGAGRDDLPHAGRGGRRSPTTRATASPPASGARPSTSRSTSRRKLKAGVVWINSTNLFDAAAGFGGYRESGFGREGGREGMLRISEAQGLGEARKPRSAAEPRRSCRASAGGFDAPAIDRTAKLYHRRQAGAAGRRLLARRSSRPTGKLVGEVGDGNRKDIRNAVEAARGAEAWSQRHRAQPRADPLLHRREPRRARATSSPRRIAAMTGAPARRRRAEVDAADRRACSPTPPGPTSTRARPHAAVARRGAGMNEPIGVVGVVCPDEAPLLAFVSLVAPLIAMGNRVVVVPSERHPLAATDFYRCSKPRTCRPASSTSSPATRERLGQDAGRARRRRCALGLRLEECVGRRGEALGRQPQAHPGRSWPRDRLVSTRRSREGQSCCAMRRR